MIDRHGSSPNSLKVCWHGWTLPETFPIILYSTPFGSSFSRFDARKQDVYFAYKSDEWYHILRDFAVNSVRNPLILRVSQRKLVDDKRNSQIFQEFHLLAARMRVLNLASCVLVGGDAKLL